MFAQILRRLVCGLLVACAVRCSETTLAPDLASLELVWSTLRDRYWDAGMAGRDWQAIHAKYRAQMEKAKTHEEAEAILRRLLRELPSSHLAIIPKALYRQPVTSSAQGKPYGNEKAEDDGDQDSGELGLDVVVIDNVFAVEHVAPNGSAAKAGVQTGWIIDSVEGTRASELLNVLGIGSKDDNQYLARELLGEWLKGPEGSTLRISFHDTKGHAVERNLVLEAPQGTLVQFGNLPPERVIVEHRLLANGAGYIRLNVFLNAVVVMPEIERAVKEFQNAPGIVLDLRGNPGGIGVMANGIAGWFVAKSGQKLGVMTSREETEPFQINPRLHAYSGRLAILVDHGSASTSEILAQGLKDLGRARIFGTRTAGAALPSDVLQLPNGDRFQYPEANYTSVNGRVLEGNGVEPDVTVAPTVSALTRGVDLPLEAAADWAVSGENSGTLENKPNDDE